MSPMVGTRSKRWRPVMAGVDMQMEEFTRVEEEPSLVEVKEKEEAGIEAYKVDEGEGEPRFKRHDGGLLCVLKVRGGVASRPQQGSVGQLHRGVEEIQHDDMGLRSTVDYSQEVFEMMMP